MNAYQILLVYCELALAVLLLGSMAPKISWLISTVLFSVFTAVSLAKGISGNESCGCFGAATVNPWLTFVMDAGVVVLLIVFRPTIAVFHWKVFTREFHRVWKSKRIIAVVVAYLILAVPATYAMMSVEKNDLAELGTEFIGADGKKTILLEPEKWVRKEFPLLPYIENTEGLHCGTWNILFYRSNCEKCHELLKCWISEEVPSSDSEKQQIAVVLVDNEHSGKPPQILKEWQQGMMDQKYKWSITTPLVVYIDNKVVRRVDLEHDLF